MHNMKILLFILFCITLTTTLNFAYAAIPYQVHPEYDTHVVTDLNDPDDVLGLENTNFETNDLIEISSNWNKTDSQRLWSQAYFIFDLNRLPDDPWGPSFILEAKDVVLPDGPKNLVLVQIPYHSWNQTAITYDSQPSSDESTIIAKTLITPDKYDYEFDIEDFVDSYDSGHLIVAIRFENLDDVGYISFPSSESTYERSPHIFAADVSVGPIEEDIPYDDGGGCLIATATYGSELAPQVQQLRELRDNKLLKTESGISFMNTFNDFYYSFSPTIADWERESPIFKEAVKIAITPMLSTLSIMTLADSEAEVLGLGISVIALNLGMYFVAPAIVIHTIRKKF